MTFKQLDTGISVSPQISLADLDTALAQGITTIINNRPDDEEPGQIAGSALAAHAKSLGLHYKAIPVTHAGFSTLQIDEMIIALERAKGPVLAFCRSGTRSTLLWALAQAKLGNDTPDGLEAKAAQAGYSLTPIRAMLDMLAAH